MENYQVLGLCALSFIAGLYCAVLLTYFNKGE